MNNNMTGNVESLMNNNLNSNVAASSNVSNLMNSNANVHAMQKLSERESMLLQVQAYEFALVEVGLFLDTHPNDQTALAYFSQYRELKHRAVSDYTRMYGPITMDHMDNDLSTWRWIDNPWPWETGSEG
ncbi:spore coat protein CotJB [Ruminiclostridium cellobioparum]|jgi:spore coat protein JB|uniref:spore coat protein CotJB n=1 Tax=Ruminiclostridium cellobioparum TaxID=29355 RepID=UPI001FA73832|nr:spore coat protein CotJB [Ruminiclostridium cellobioparum]